MWKLGKRGKSKLKQWKNHLFHEKAALFSLEKLFFPFSYYTHVFVLSIRLSLAPFFSPHLLVPRNLACWLVFRESKLAASIKITKMTYSSTYLRHFFGRLLYSLQEIHNDIIKPLQPIAPIMPIAVASCSDIPSESVPGSETHWCTHTPLTEGMTMGCRAD